jgi:hypothetical protein
MPRTDDRTSVETLTETTFQCFSHEKVRLLYIRAQVTLIDLKIDLALGEVMRIYKRILGSTVSTAGVPSAITSNRMAAAIDVCRSIITCFGVQTVSAETAMEICKANVWDDMGNNFHLALAEAAAAVSLASTIISGGIPFFLIPMAANIPLVVPATVRLFLMLACDLTLILRRAFMEATIRCVGQPVKKDVEAAARAYRQHCKEVHQRIKKLVPRGKIHRSFQTNVIKLGITSIVEEFKTKVMEDVGFPKSPGYRNEHQKSLSVLSFDSETLNEDREDIRKAVAEMKEMNGRIDV